MAIFFLTILLLLTSYVSRGECSIHLPLHRRGGRLSTHDLANLTSLSNILALAEAQFARSHREIEGNRLVRRWRSLGRDENDPFLIDVAGRSNRW